MERINTFDLPTSDFSRDLEQGMARMVIVSLLGLAFFWARYNPIKKWKADRPDGIGSSPSINKLTKKREKWVTLKCWTKHFLS